jgi:hypothetical protein
MWRLVCLLLLALVSPAWAAPFATSCLPADAQITACDFEDTTLGETARVPVEIDLVRGCSESGYRVCKFNIQHWAPGSEHQCRMRSVHAATGSTSGWLAATLSRPATALAVLQIIAAQPPPPPPPPPPAMATVLDDFNRSNGALGANYTASHGAGLAIASNAVVGTGGESRGSMRTAEAFDADQSVQVTLTTNTASKALSLFVRGSGADGTFDGYYASVYFGSSWNIVRSDNGSEVATIASGNVGVDFAIGDVIKLDITGSTLTLTRNGTTLGSGNDSTITSGKPGFETYGALGFDNAVFTGAPGGAVSLVVQDSTHAHASANVGLTTDATLAVANAAHAHASANVGLSTEVGLTIANAAHAHTSDSPSPSTQVVLAPADANHAHASENVGLSTEVGLTIANAAHAHAADTVGLSTDVLLAPADATHGHSSENAVLGATGETTLTPADVMHGHSSENVGLTYELALDIAHANHAHTVDGVSLSTEVLLAIDAAVHAHLADNVGLSTVPVLQIADGLHAHTSDGVDLTLDAWLVVADALHGHTVDNVVLLVPGGENWPHPATVLAGIAYGPTGTEYVGTMQMLTAAQVWAHLIEGGMSAEQMQRVQFAAIAGKSTGVGTDTETYMGVDGETQRLVVTFDSFGNRETVAVDGS